MGKNTMQPLDFYGNYNIIRAEINRSKILGIISADPEPLLAVR